jgi:hypothetical protein
MIKNLTLIRNFFDKWLFSGNFIVAVLSTLLLKLIVIIPFFIYVYFDYENSSLEQEVAVDSFTQEEFIIQVISRVVLAPIWESILLGGLILGMRKLKVPATWIILVPAMVLAILHFSGDFYSIISKFPQFVIYSYVFYHSFKITTKFGAFCRITAVHALNNALIFLM